MMVVKMLRSGHSIDMCGDEVTSRGLKITEPTRGYRALTSGIPGPWSLDSDKANLPIPAQYIARQTTEK